MESVKTDKSTCHWARWCTEHNEQECDSASETQHPGVFQCFDVCLFDLVGCSTKLDGTQSRSYLCQCLRNCQNMPVPQVRVSPKVNHLFFPQTSLQTCFMSGDAHIFQKKRTVHGSSPHHNTLLHKIDLVLSQLFSFPRQCHHQCPQV